MSCQQFDLAPTIQKRGDAGDRVATLRKSLPHLCQAQLPGDSLPIPLTPMASLFPSGGIPLGHLFEITGSISCGKSSLLMHLLAMVPGHVMSAYVDASGTLFPVSALRSNVPCDRLSFIPAESEAAAALAAEGILVSGAASVVACDLTNRRHPLSTGLIHRLRTTAIRHQGVVFFLTDCTSMVLPPSTMSAQLSVARSRVSVVSVTVTKSRIMPVGKHTEVVLT